MGDSTIRSFTELYPHRYPAFLEQDLGVKLTIYDRTIDAWSSQGMLNALRTDTKLRQIVCNANVIIFTVPRYIFNSPGNIYTNGAPGACGGTDNQDCLRKALKLYEDHVDEIFAQIISLRSPSDALIRTMDEHTYWPVAESKMAGTFDGMNYWWQEANTYLTQVATYYQIPVARVNEAFNGPSGSDDPVDKGYLGSDDPIHPIDKGKEIMADLVRGLGYGYAPKKP